MKPTPADLANAVARLSVLVYFPSTDGATVEIVRMLGAMCSTRDQLDWLVTMMINHVGEWKGPKELRGLFCTKYKPADGIEESCSIPGFTPGEAEMRAVAAPSTGMLAVGPASVNLLMNTQVPASSPPRAQTATRRTEPNSMRRVSIDAAEVRRVENDLANLRPTLSGDEKQRRLAELQATTARFGSLGSPKPDSPR